MFTGLKYHLTTKSWYLNTRLISGLKYDLHWKFYYKVPNRKYLTTTSCPQRSQEYVKIVMKLK